MIEMDSIQDGLTPCQRYYRKNKEKRLAESKEWRDKNQDKTKESKADWFNRNPEWSREYNKRAHVVDKQSIRNATRKEFGKAEVCSKCVSRVNVQHHHNTIPYRVDKFVDLCRPCHGNAHSEDLK